jgi:UDP-3-O-[3-hydroxymyristoyl] glucosamine N-acyltransferase
VRDKEFSSLGRVRDWQKNRLVFITDSKELDLLNRDLNISAVITYESLAKYIPESLGLLIVDNPEKAFSKIHLTLMARRDFYPRDFKNDISSDAVIHETAVISDNSVRIGRNCRIGPKAFIGPHTEIGDGVTIGPGTIIGADWGNLLSNDSDIFLARAGGVKIGKKVWLHCNCVIERSIFGGLTEIGDYTYLDSLVSVGAGAKIGRACIIVAAAIIGQSACLDDEIWVGPNAVIAEGVRVGRKGSISLGSVVIDDVPAGKKVTGNFAVDHMKFIDFMRRFK